MTENQQATSQEEANWTAPETGIEAESFGEIFVRESREREEQRDNERWGEGTIGHLNKTLNTTRLGRYIKTTGRIALGLGVAASATMISGPAGLLIAPVAYALGKREAIDGTLEGIQALAKGNKLRIGMEARKQDKLLMEDALLGIEEQLSSGELTRDEYWVLSGDLVREIRQTEADIINAEQENIAWESKQKYKRGIVSSVATLALGYLQGVPLGKLNLDGGEEHLVKLSRHGFDFIYNKGEEFAGAAFKVWGQMAHAMGHGVPPLGFAGIGTAFMGLFAKSASEYKNMRANTADRMAEEEQEQQNTEQTQNQQTTNSRQESNQTGNQARASEANTGSSGADAGQHSEHSHGQDNTGRDNSTQSNQSGGSQSSRRTEASGSNTGSSGAGAGQHSEQSHGQEHSGHGHSNQENESGSNQSSETHNDNSKESPDYDGNPFDYDKFDPRNNETAQAHNRHMLQQQIERIICHSTLTPQQLEARFASVTHPNIEEVRKLLLIPASANKAVVKRHTRLAMGFASPDRFQGNPRRKEMAELLFKIVNNGTEELIRRAA